MEMMIVTLIAVALVESMLLIAQGEENEHKNDMIRFLEFRVKELERKGGKSEGSDGDQGDLCEAESSCTDRKGQGAVQ